MIGLLPDAPEAYGIHRAGGSGTTFIALAAETMVAWLKGQEHPSLTCSGSGSFNWRKFLRSVGIVQRPSTWIEGELFFSVIRSAKRFVGACGDFNRFKFFGGFDTLVHSFWNFLRD